MFERARDVREAIRAAWPHAWTLSGANERLDAPAGSPRAWRPWWSVKGRRGLGAVNPRRWSGQSYHERLAEHEREREGARKRT